MTAARLTVLDATVLERLRTEQLRDAIDDAGPDALVATSVGARNRLRASPAVPDELPTLLVAGGGSAGAGSTDDASAADANDATDASDAADANDIRDAAPQIHRFGDVDVVVATSDDELAGLASLAADGEPSADDAPDAVNQLDPATETYVLTDRLSLSVRPTELTTEIEGLDAYGAALERGLADGQLLPGLLTHVSTALPADYFADDGALTLRGAAPAVEDVHGVPLGGASGDAAVPTLALGPDGAVGTREIGPDSLGLRAVRGVGPERAATLRSAGVRTRDALADADLARLADVDGLGRGTACRLREHALAHRDGRVVRRGDGTLPGREPVFVDVETDGLSPSIVWLVGVLASGANEGSSEAADDESDGYVSFLATDPDEPGEALAAFCSWYFANASDRPIAAYNGWSFDFPVIEEQIERHCPQYLEDWRGAWRIDPYDWAVREGNAVLSGRTNQLADVAAALGYKSTVDGDGTTSATHPTPLTGAEVGRTYRRWIRDRTPDAEPDWQRLEAYCEDDVRALAHVYDALADADRREVATAGGGATGERTTQGSLGDFADG